MAALLTILSIGWLPAADTSFTESPPFIEWTCRVAEPYPIFRFDLGEPVNVRAWHGKDVYEVKRCENCQYWQAQNEETVAVTIRAEFKRSHIGWRVRRSTGIWVFEGR